MKQPPSSLMLDVSFVKALFQQLFESIACSFDILAVKIPSYNGTGVNTFAFRAEAVQGFRPVDPVAAFHHWVDSRRKVCGPYGAFLIDNHSNSNQFTLTFDFCVSRG